MGAPKECAIQYTGAAVAGVALGVDQPASTTTVRGRIQEFDIGSHATPVDQATMYQLVRYGTALPTGGSTPTIAYNDTADGAAQLSVFAAATGGATIGTTLWELGIHMKASYRWVAQPGREWVIPATNFAGIGIYAPAGNQTAAYNYDLTLMWDE